MIVENTGYLKLEQVLNLTHFSIYETNKKTHILIRDSSIGSDFLYYPKQDRLPYKITEGKKICFAKKVFDSTKDDITSLTTEKWNNKNQIMTYEEYYKYYS